MSFDLLHCNCKARRARSRILSFYTPTTIHVGLYHQGDADPTKLSALGLRTSAFPAADPLLAPAKQRDYCQVESRWLANHPFGHQMSADQLSELSAPDPQDPPQAGHPAKTCDKTGQKHLSSCCGAKQPTEA